MPITERCETCRFFMDDECRFNPPVLVGRESLFPETTPDSWCGKYEMSKKLKKTEGLEWRGPIFRPKKNQAVLALIGKSLFTGWYADGQIVTPGSTRFNWTECYLWTPIPDLMFAMTEASMRPPAAPIESPPPPSQTVPTPPPESDSPGST
jgi:hypothetical protein